MTKGQNGRGWSDDGISYTVDTHATQGVAHVVAPAVSVCPTLRAGGNQTGGDRPPGTDVDTADSLLITMTHDRAVYTGRMAHVVAPPLTATNDPSRSPQSSEVTAQVEAVLRAQYPEVAEVCGTISDGAHNGGGLNGQDAYTGRVLPVRTGTMAVRRLTPVECERLQGFPTVSETIIFNVCLEPQNNAAHVATKCLRSLNNAWHAAGSASLQNAKHAAEISSTSPEGHAPLVRLHVLMNSEDELQAVHSLGKLIWSASNAAPSSKFLPPTLIGDTVRQIAALSRELVKEAPCGKAASLQPINFSLTGESGSKSAEKSGPETAVSADDVASALPLERFITSSRMHDIRNSGSTEQTLFCSVMIATSGFIPNAILPRSFSAEITVETPYTAIPWKNKPASECPDGPRYKALGNSMAVPCMYWIGWQIRKAMT